MKMLSFYPLYRKSKERRGQMTNKYAKATFAGGCFWCMVEPFDERPGIIDVISGYTGGEKEDPTYEEVCTGRTGHVEAVQITYDPRIVSYQSLVDLFWQQIDPTDSGGQFADRGESYTTAIFYHNQKQKEIAEASKLALEKSGRFSKPIVTKIREAKTFYPAESYHQYYYKKNKAHYAAYKQGSGRADFIQRVWKDKGEARVLNPMQYYVTKQNGTEPPFQNEYWDEFRDGIYVDILSGKVLFSSKDKFDAQCGWPSFTKPVHPEEITEHIDRSYGMVRTEVRSKTADNHLGHVFPDGPKERGGLRYCINSAALRFIPKEDMEDEGYGDYLYLFEEE